jgi:transcriptional regulator GlxA family with amidase domain
MKKVYFLAMHDTMASFMAAMDIFYQAGVMWNSILGQEVTPFFDVKIVTTTGKPFTCLNGVRIIPDGSINDAQDSDLIVVTSIIDIDQTLQVQREVIDWLKDRNGNGSHIASICTGAFVLAETGLLDGKTATTHWCQTNNFAKRYPQIKLKPERLITDEGDLFCSGGFNSGIDLSLYLVEKYCGHQVALESSKFSVFDIGRSSQMPYTIFQFQKDHHDSQILAVQDWIEDKYDQNFSYAELARHHGMSRRTLERRFKAATGDSPLSYQQRVRVEKAKRMLEDGQLPFDEITYQVGYEDSGSFRKVFLRHAGLRPNEYRNKFQRI